MAEIDYSSPFSSYNFFHKQFSTSHKPGYVAGFCFLKKTTDQLLLFLPFSLPWKGAPSLYAAPPEMVCSRFFGGLLQVIGFLPRINLRCHCASHGSAPEPFLTPVLSFADKIRPTVQPTPAPPPPAGEAGAPAARRSTPRRSCSRRGPSSSRASSGPRTPSPCSRRWWPPACLPWGPVRPALVRHPRRIDLALGGHSPPDQVLRVMGEVDTRALWSV